MGRERAPQVVKWDKPQQWYVRSTCGRFTVSKGLVHGVPWYLLHEGRQIIGDRHATAESAMNAANGI